MLCVPQIGAALLLLLILSGCAGPDAFSAEEAEKDLLFLAALFQTENGDALQGGAARFSTEETGGTCLLDRGGEVSVSGVPRSGEP